MTWPLDPKGGSLSTEALVKGVHDTLESAFAAIPDGHTHAVLFDGTYAQTDGVSMRALYVQRAPDGWNVVMEGDYDGPHGVAGQVKLAKSW